MVDIQFYEYVSKLLYESGHMITSDPVYYNHSASETLYIDSSKDVAVSRFDRTLLMQISNVSLLYEIKWPGVVDDLTENVQVYSISIDAPDRNRSQIVADTHRLLHQYWDCHHSIVFFKNRNKYIISFANKDQAHILSDWFDINIDYDEIVEKIDTANLSFESSIDYFSDFIYAVARDYYIHPISAEEATYGMLPLTFVASALGVTTEVTKEDIKAIARANMSAFESQYGDDYVAPVYAGFDEQARFRRMATELDKISFELELAAEMDADEIETFNDDTDDDFDEFDDDFIDDWEDDVDTRIFDDPVLMVKWLEQRQKQLDEEGDGRKNGLPKQICKDSDLGGQVHRVTGHSEYECTEAEHREQEHLEAERREKERLEAEHREQERLEAERRERERLEAERQEQERLEAERREQERLEAERREQERLEAERREQERLEAERRERERLEAERREQERLETERRERERLEAERREQERLETERREQERLEAERRERERLEAERREQERLEAERREQECLEAERKRKANLEQEHKVIIARIQKHYKAMLEQVDTELESIDTRLDEINKKLPTLNFLQFIEKKNLKAEQDTLLSKKEQLCNRRKEIIDSLKEQIVKEHHRYNSCLEEV